MRLTELLEGLGINEPCGPNADPEIGDIAYDSRRVAPGDLFVALRGAHTDGHLFVEAAVEAGAVAVAVEDPARAAGVVGRAAVVEVPDSRAFLALASQRLYQHPSAKLWLAGVTGTDGKTTTCYLLHQMLATVDAHVGLLTTVTTGIGSDMQVSERTTPEAPDICRVLGHVRASGGKHAVMEVSSHALTLRRTLGLEFDAIALTNVSADHLDFHGTREEYAAAKLRLFREYPEATAKQVTGVLNADDPLYQMFKGETRCKVVSVGFSEEADLRITSLSQDKRGTQIQVHTPEGLIELRVALFGAFNAHNAVTAGALARAAGIDWLTAAQALSKAKPPPGRLERVDEGQPFSVFVDYAHTPEALETVLHAARDMAAGRVIVVFGCGGDRDPTKRPQMGGIAARLASTAVITSDNPRSEKPEDIIDEILEGAKAGNVVVEPDRRRAIEQALGLAQPGDLVVIAGKGHETYQQFADHTIHFDDREVARAALRAIMGEAR